MKSLGPDADEAMQACQTSAKEDKTAYTQPMLSDEDYSLSLRNACRHREQRTQRGHCWLTRNFGLLKYQQLHDIPADRLR